MPAFLPLKSTSRCKLSVSASRREEGVSEGCCRHHAQGGHPVTEVTEHGTVSKA